MTEKQLAAQMEMHIKLKAKIAEMEKKLSVVDGKLTAHMDEKGVNEIELNGMTAKRSETLTHRFDSKAFKAENPDLYASYYTESIRRNFTVKTSK